MSFYVWCELVCRECSITSEGVFTSNLVPRKILKARGKKAGWRFDREGDVTCPHCVREGK